ncbi:amidase family protein [Arthrobacter wenxiniae]|uniref:Amidase n=1 Tax=Arthrobacter wenxiniae TaxID=2713570 RepID=A0A7Y7IFK3_9MICC|nr:amidase [Arthrobacter wenxiniae]
MNPTTALEIRNDVVTGKRTATEVLDETLAAITASDGRLHSFLTVDERHAREQVAELERRRVAGESPGLLWGVPFSVKDTYDTAGVRTTYGSRVFADHVPTNDAEFVRRIRRAGGILVGKTNTPEFAIYIRSTNDLQPETVNPWDPNRTSGGSSGGAAASIGAGLTTIAVGSDGGGSIRIPAALCGCVGLMPARGALPRTGGRIGTRRFSSAGPMTLDALDAQLLYQVMAGPFAPDGLSRGLTPTGLRQGTGFPASPRMRWIGDSGIPGAEDDVVSAVHAAALAFARSHGGTLEERDEIMDAGRFSGAFYDMMQADRLSTGGRELYENPETRALLTDYSRHQFQRATTVSGAAYSAGVEMQLAALEYMEELLDGVDLLVTPTVAFVAPEIPIGDLALPEDARRGFVAFTYLMNYTGLPAVTVPCGVVRGLPVGMQLIGRPGSEELLLAYAARFQERVYRLPSAPVHPYFEATLTSGSNR